MKKKILLSLGILVTTISVFAGKTFFSINSKNFFCPKEFEYIPSSDKNYAFFCMKEPVKVEDFKKYLSHLKKKGDTKKLTQYSNSIKISLDNQSKYVLITNLDVINDYAKYLKELIEQKQTNFIVSIRSINEDELLTTGWRENYSGSKLETKYQIVYFKNLQEYFYSKSQTAVSNSPSDRYPKGFRLVLSLASKSTVSK
jgi:hypothetical protein